MKRKMFGVLLLLILLLVGCSPKKMLEKVDQYLIEGDLEKAEQTLIEVVDRWPEDAAGRRNLGFVYLYQGRIEEAIGEFETALEYNKKPDLEYLGLGQAYLSKGEYDRAKEYLEKARSVGSYPATEYLLGFLYLDDEDLPKARVALKNASKVYPERGEIWAALGKLSLQNMQALDAVQAFQMAYAYGIRHYDLYAGLAESYYQLGNYRKAISVTEQALTQGHIDQMEKEALHLKLAQYNVNQNPTKAIESFKEILHQNPYKPEVLLMLGQLYFQQKKYAQAISTFKTYLKKYPPLAPMMHIMYDSYMALGNVKEAETYLKEAIHTKPDNYSFYVELLNLYHQQKRWTDAVPVYEAAIKLRPNDRELLKNLISIFFSAQKYERVIPYLEKALRQDPNNINLLLLKAQAHFRLHQIEEEEAVYKRVLAMDSKNLLAMNNLAQLYRDTKKLDQAIELYKKAQLIAPNDSNYDRNMAAIYLLQGGYVAAQESAKKAIARNSRDYEAYRYLGDAYFAQDKYTLAIQNYEKSLSIKKDFYPAMYPLGKAYFYANNYEKAYKYLSAFRKQFPNHENCKFYLTRTEWMRKQKSPGFKLYPAKP